ncbi:MAG: CBS domain-containing protein [Candidatus Methanomethylicia archaeon]
MYEVNKVREIMTENVIYCEVPSTRVEVLSIMKKHNLTCLPVVKKGTKKLVGIITRYSLLEKPMEEQTALIMTRDPIYVSPNHRIKDLAKAFIDHRIRYIPVVDNDELVGMVTVSDIVHKVLTKSTFYQPIKNFIERNFIALWDKTPINVGWRIMELAKIYAAPVINSKLEVVGIFSASDIFSHIEIVVDEHKHVVKAATEGQEWDWDSLTIIYVGSKKLILPEKPISEIMKREIVTLREETSISQCAKKMRDLNLHILPVVNSEGVLTGVINDVNLIKILT